MFVFQRKFGGVARRRRVLSETKHTQSLLQGPGPTLQPSPQGVVACSEEDGTGDLVS